ncbi:MAG: acyl-CoA dehydrogenase family protein [Pseudomonadota bacterium]
MDLGISDRVKPLLARVADMVETEIIPLDQEFHDQIGATGDRFHYNDRMIEILDGLKAKARERGLWNFWLTNSDHGHGLTNVDYAYLAEEMGKARIAPEVFNCNAPDTGNMEVFETYGSAAHKERWLKPLMDGEIRSAFAMTEPMQASSDATQISLRAERYGDDWVLNGEKWWITGAGNPRCKVFIVMACSDPDAPKHARHSQFVMARETPGIEILRPMQAFGDDDAPMGHMHLRFTDVRVPAEDLLLGEGRGFEVAQGRLGPGRIHHCMRTIGLAERALEIMCRRGLARSAFGKPLAELGGNYDLIANARINIEQSRLLCLKAAHMMDTIGTREAQPWISMIKVAAPLMALDIIDEAMQLHGAEGISQDTPLAAMWTGARTMRLVDGPDAVHRRQIARREMRQYTNEKV